MFYVAYNNVVSFEIAFNHLLQLAQASSHDCHVTSYLVKAYLLQSNTARAEEVRRPIVSVLPSAGLILVFQILPSPQILQNLETSVGGDDDIMLGLQVHLLKLICMEDLIFEGLRTTVDSPQ